MKRKLPATANKLAKITVLSLLKNYYDEQIFSILIKDFYDSDLDISLAAIRASGSIGNEVAIPHLYRIIEHGKPEQQGAAIRTLSEINAPSSIENLVKYVHIFPGLRIRSEILRAINKISPFHQQVLALNQAVLEAPKSEPELLEIVVEGLIDAGQLDLIKANIYRITPTILRIIFTRLLESSIPETDKFIDSFGDAAPKYDPHTLGCYLCAYELKTAKPKMSYIVDLLQNSDPRTTSSFMMVLTNFDGHIRSPSRLFRLLLRSRFVDQATESLNGDLLTKIVEEVRAHSPLILNEFIFTTATHLEAVFSKLRKQHISLEGITEKNTLLIFVLAKILERYATPKLLKRTQVYFRTNSPVNPEILIRDIEEQLRGVDPEDIHRFQACIPLFVDRDSKARLNISQTLSTINLNSYSLLRRLNRLIRVIGALEIKNSGKKILEIVQFSRTERIPFLEETCVVTLCQLMNRAAVEQAKPIFAEAAQNVSSVNGYIRGARYLPAKIFINPLLKLLLNPGLNVHSQELIVKSIEQMNLSDSKTILPLLVRALRFPEIGNDLKLKISEILSKFGDAAIFQPILDLTNSTELDIRRVGIRTLRHLVLEEKKIPRDILTSRLYLLLEDPSKPLRIEALLALLTMRDDYAIQILEDYINSGDEAGLVELIKNLQQLLNREILSLILGLINSTSEVIQEQLRGCLQELCQGSYAEEIRKTLLDFLKEQKGSITETDRTTGSESLADDMGIVEHAKIEFKFKRENSQTLTVFFIDIVSYTEKSAQADTSDLFKLIQTFEEIALPTIARLKGILIKKLGDGLLAVFKHPMNAAIAALTIQKAIAENNQFKVDSEKFDVRIGLNTGLVIRKGGDIYGDTVNVASRMETSASPGDVLLTGSTYEEIKEYVRCTHLGNIQVKGKEDPITSYSAEEILVDTSQILTDAKDISATEKEKNEPASLTTLKESIFTPEFTVHETSQVDEELKSCLISLFTDITAAMEDVTRDYHDEYIIKRYLQDKWNEIMALYGQIPI